MRGIEATLDELERHMTAAGRKAMVRDVRAEVRRLIAERDAARAALRADGEADGLQMVITPTAHLTELDGVPVRIWKGRTLEGTQCHVFVHRVAVGGAADQVRFEAELIEVAGPDRPEDILSILERLEANHGGLELD